MSLKFALNRDEVIRLYLTPLSALDVARIMGVSAETIRKRLIEWGIPRHPEINLPRPQPNKARKMEKNGFWNGGRIVDKHGYVLLKMNNHPDANRSGYVREHRLVMEKKLGRRLLRSEVVHHMDGLNNNNHPDNLELFQDNAAHLASTLLGKCPKWTEEGYQKMLQSAQRKATIAASTQMALETYALANNTTVAILRLSLSKGDTTLLKMAAILGRLEPLDELRKERETIRRDWLALGQSEKSVLTDRKLEYLP